MTRVRVTTAAKKFGLAAGTISEAKKTGRITDAGHGYCYEEEIVSIARSKALKTFAYLSNQTHLEKENVDRERSITYEEAAALYNVDVKKIIYWKSVKKLDGPRNRVWKDQVSPDLRIKSGSFGPRTFTGGAGYTVNTRAPRIDPAD